MNKTQKAAIYGLYLVGFMLIIPLVDLVETKVNPVLLRAIGYPLAFLMVLPIWFLTRKKNQTDIEMDERDKIIIKRACLVAGGLVSTGLLAVYTISIFTIEPDGKIQFSILPIIVFFSSIAFLLVLSLTVLIQYKLGGGSGNK